MGDASDNIPGVRGIGEKNALDSINRFDNIDYIYENLDKLEILDSIREKLCASRDSYRQPAAFIVVMFR